MNGLDLSWLDYAGPARAPTIVLLHAMWLSARDWHAVAASLARRRRVVVPDLRGHGETVGGGLRYSFQDMRDDVIALAGHLESGAVELAGHSLGGTVALLVAELRPELVTKLVLEDTPALERGLSIDLPAHEPPGFHHNWDMTRAIVGQLNAPDARWWRDLPLVDCPVLVVGGGDTSHVDQRELRATAKRLRHGRFVTIGGGHSVHQNRLDDFLAAVQPFLFDT